MDIALDQDEHEPPGYKSGVGKEKQGQMHSQQWLVRLHGPGKRDFKNNGKGFYILKYPIYL